MKKLMLIMAAALVSLSACSKSADEPVAPQNQSDEVLTSINLKIEGEREPIQVVEGEQAIDQQGRALNLTGTTDGRNKLTGITLGDTESVEGVVYIYTPGKATPSIARRVLFNVKGNKISYYGKLENVFLSKGALDKGAKMDVYVGGRIKRDDINVGRDARGGSVEYYPSNLALRTEGTMDLSAFHPIFYSTNVPVSLGADGADRDYYSTNHRFKLYGEFVSVRFRMKTRTRGATGTFNGFLVRGFGRDGITLDAPDAGNKYKPTMRPSTPSANLRTGRWNGFSDKSRPDAVPYKFSYQIGGVPYEDTPVNRRDVAYTLYLFSNAEEHGGFRLGFNKSPDIFSKGIGFQNYPGYWGGDASNTYHSREKNWGKFHNLILVYEF